ncbi:3-oxo-5-alpha-steroid 4-dehydrogenase 1 [Coprinopsis marcescibilis]|uniref:3-oxo-5-alpha-steroid 4-dehydrogenase 1 n=1 Tax=Coprinopsis marcescibilis TaxID=230819 RepID=A0A5C3L4B9_COPMA|nr:3-oxo-5-alpha-steroid 4-dehydrogenase 1 [Coprinopsis marcescibilis]
MARDPTQLNTANWPLDLYNGFRKWLVLIPLVLLPILFVVNAPFGRFMVSASPIGFFNWKFLHVDGIKSWIFMETVSPLTFIYAFLISPLTFYTPPTPDWTSPQMLLAMCFMLHYLNRAFISPLRTPSRSKQHVVITLVAVMFNISNGYLMGTYFSSPLARIYLGDTYVYSRPSFWIGITLFFAGFAGNVIHDEILLDIRRKAIQRKQRGGEEKEEAEKKQTKIQAPSKPAYEGSKEYYGIPQGLLYTYISFPNYFCEWVEWFGFALASAPPPIELSFSSSSEFFSSLFQAVTSLFDWETLKYNIAGPTRGFAPTLYAPWIFLIAEVAVMFPRAYKGHLWYKEHFGERYPKNRKAVIPFVI